MTNKEYFNSLTGLRAIAAILVYFHHFPISGVKPFGLDIQRELHIGVSLFFVLSGFLISSSYFGNINSIEKYLVYLRNRVARLYPVYFIILSFFFIVRVYKHDNQSFWDYFLNYSMMKGFWDSMKFSGIAQSWSLTVEFIFYIAAPIFFIIIEKIKFAKFGVLSFLIAVLLTWISIIFFNFEDSRFLLLYTFYGRFFEFIIGMLIFNSKFMDSYRFGYRTHIGCLGVISCVICFCLLKTEQFDFGIYSSLGIVINNLILPFFVALIIIGLIKEQTILKRILEKDIMQVLGKSSYVFYLIHMGFFHNFMLKYMPQIHILGSFICFVLLWVMSVLMYNYVEKPLYQLLYKKLGNA